MEIQFNLADETSKFLQQIIKLEASLRGSLTGEDINDLLVEIFKKGMDSVYDEQVDDFYGSMEEDSEKAFEQLKVGPHGIFWLNDFGIVMEIAPC